MGGRGVRGGHRCAQDPQLQASPFGRDAVPPSSLLPPPLSPSFQGGTALCVPSIPSPFAVSNVVWHTAYTRPYKHAASLLVGDYLGPRTANTRAVNSIVYYHPTYGSQLIRPTTIHSTTDSSALGRASIIG